MHVTTRRAARAAMLRDPPVRTLTAPVDDGKGPPPLLPSPAAAAAAAPAVVFGHGLYTRPHGPTATLLATVLGEVVHDAEEETVTPEWAAFVHILRTPGVRRLRLTDLGPAAEVRFTVVGDGDHGAAAPRFVLPRGARRYGDARFNGLAAGGALTVRQVGVPGADDGRFGFVFTGGPTVPVIRAVRCSVRDAETAAAVEVDLYDQRGRPVRLDGVGDATVASLAVRHLHGDDAVDVELRDAEGDVVARCGGLVAGDRQQIVPQL